MKGERELTNVRRRNSHGQTPYAKRPRAPCQGRSPRPHHARAERNEITLTRRAVLLLVCSKDKTTHPVDSPTYPQVFHKGIGRSGRTSASPSTSGAQFVKRTRIVAIESTKQYNRNRAQPLARIFVQEQFKIRWHGVVHSRSVNSPRRGSSLNLLPSTKSRSSTGSPTWPLRPAASHVKSRWHVKRHRRSNAASGAQQFLRDELARGPQAGDRR